MTTRSRATAAYLPALRVRRDRRRHLTGPSIQFVSRAVGLAAWRACGRRRFWGERGVSRFYPVVWLDCLKIIVPSRCQAREDATQFPPSVQAAENLIKAREEYEARRQQFLRDARPALHRFAPGKLAEDEVSQAAKKAAVK